MHLICLFLLILSTAQGSPDPSSFKFSVKTEPRSLDDITYVVGNLYRGLTRLTEDGNLIFDQAERCSYKTPVLIKCHLRKESKWSDGSQVRAQDFISGFRRLLSSKSKISTASLLFGIKNARGIYEGKISDQDLGMRAEGDGDLVFELTSNDTEFFEKLSDPLLVPHNGNLFDGPYKLRNWIKGKELILEPNTYFYGGAKSRPVVEVYFIRDESKVLDLYEKGSLNFVTGIGGMSFSKFKARRDLFERPMARFDYIGFNLRKGSLFENRDRRKVFAESLDFEAFKVLFPTRGVPGCPGLGEAILPGEEHCLRYVNSPPKLTTPRAVKFFNGTAPEVSWFQDQWRRNLHVTMDVKGSDQIKSSDIFFKESPLNRPTCLAGLEQFRKDGPENLVGFENTRFENLTESLVSKKMSMSEKQGICGVATDLLFKEEFVAIPLGPGRLWILASKNFHGWKINSLNQLDLSELTYEQE